MKNETERIELLKAVAACAPKEMLAIFCYYGRVPLGSSSTSDFAPNCTAFCNTVLRLTESDSDDAEAIIVMLDALEKDGYVIQEFIRHDVCYDLWLRTGSDYMHGSGATRAEAVSRAFVSVFTVATGGKEEK